MKYRNLWRFFLLIFDISKIYPYYEVKRKNLKNFSQNFGKITLFGVGDSERKIRKFGKLSSKQNAEHFRKRILFFYACYETYHITNQRKDGKGMKGNKNKIQQIISRNREIWQVKQSFMKSAVHFMKCLFLAAALN